MPAGKEQFRRAVTEFRNLHIVAGLEPLILMRTELVSNDEFMSRGGTDEPTQLHMKELLVNADKLRRHVTHNPDGGDLGDKIAKAIDPNAKVEIGENPFGGDDIQNMSGGLIDLPYLLDGSDPDIPLNSQLKPQFLKSKGMLLLGAIDRTITNWTRLNSRDRTRFITRYDSMRIYGSYQEILGYINMYLGDDNRVDVAQMLPSEEPLGPQDSPNIKGESSSATPAT